MMELNPSDAELIIGVVARIGVNTGEIITNIQTELAQYGYEVHEIRVTSLLNAFEERLALVRSPRAQRYFSYIKACNLLRDEIYDNVMALLAIMEIVTNTKASGL